MTPEVEARFAAIESILAATAQQQAVNTQAITRLEATIAANSDSISRLETTIAANSDSITRLEVSIGTTNRNLHDEVTNMASIISEAIASFDASARRSELAAAAMERLVDALTDRFRANGHND